MEINRVNISKYNMSFKPLVTFEIYKQQIAQKFKVRKLLKAQLTHLIISKTLPEKIEISYYPKVYLNTARSSTVFLMCQ